MQGYERDTWYDMHGRIGFTKSKGLVGVGLPRKGGVRPRDHPHPCPTAWEKSRARSKVGKNSAQLQESGHLPDDSVATTTVTDDTLPGGPRKVERRYTAPFALANREADYRITWEFFEKKTTQ